MASAMPKSCTKREKRRIKLTEFFVWIWYVCFNSFHKIQDTYVKIRIAEAYV